ncbi:hypothetical protein Landi51_12931 [Colletotrichum acutatum]
MSPLVGIRWFGDVIVVVADQLLERLDSFSNVDDLELSPECTRSLGVPADNYQLRFSKSATLWIVIRILSSMSETIRNSLTFTSSSLTGPSNRFHRRVHCRATPDNLAQTSTGSNASVSLMVEMTASRSFPSQIKTNGASENSGSITSRISFLRWTTGFGGTTVLFTLKTPALFLQPIGVLIAEGGNVTGALPDDSVVLGG